MKRTQTTCALQCLSGILLIFLIPLNGQNHHARFESIDIQSYRFEINLNDTSDIFRAQANIGVQFKKELDYFSLDLSERDDKGTGMVVDEISMDGESVKYVHVDDGIKITVRSAKKGEIRNYQINYHGIPADGLIISRNKFGDRTFFGDNWPNRAHQWLPVVDHPSDKAVVEFLVHAPDHYGVVANGTLINEKKEDGRISSHWKTTVPLPTKLMVIGVSPFAVQHFQSASGIPISTWVYPQNREEGFYDYSIASLPVDYFESYIAPYPYSKLANVQSKTVYGGMENASCIFYREGTVTGKQQNEILFAHEIAHQWFGDAVSELDWHHIWLSEGFATYLSDLYIEHTHGREAFVASMLDEKGQVLRFARRRLAPIVDTSLPVSVRLLNKNSYEKGGWVLHMLRRDLGDALFQQCIQTFYEKYKYGNALTEDFQKVVESLSGESYAVFFQQWFYQAGHPVLSAQWKKKGRSIKLSIRQHQEQCLFEFPLDIEMINDKGESFRKTFTIHSAKQTFKFKSSFEPTKIILDPDTWLLFEPYGTP